MRTPGATEVTVSAATVRPAVDRTASTQRGGSVVFVLLVAGMLVGAATGIVVLGRSNAEPYILGLLAVLATLGVFSLFAWRPASFASRLRRPRAR
jgi:two-component system cell cycle sensor histidine kinase/response regulator CckA